MSKNKKIALTSYLYGDSGISKISEMWDSRRSVYLPVQSSPLKEYVHDVNRFLFSGGINANILDLPEEHYSHKLIEDVCNKYIHPNLFPIWEMLAITGELLTIVRIVNGNVTFEFFDPREYSLTTVNKKITEIKVKTVVELEGKRYIYRFEVNAFNFAEYPLVEEHKENNYDWEAVKTLNNHGFKRLPAKLISINKSLTNNRGNSEFNHSALMLAKSIATIEYGLDENVYFFGHPLIDSPDPEQTTKDLNSKKQVLQKLPPDEGGGHELIQPQTLTETELNWLKIKKESFKRSMGITNTQETSLRDASGIALRIMNDGLISKAQSKWEEIVTYGIEDLLDLVLRLAEDLGNISLGGTKESIVSITRAEPYFIRTEQEKLQSLDVAERLIQLGVDRALALQETYYTHKSLEEIEKLLRPNLEDI